MHTLNTLLTVLLVGCHCADINACDNNACDTGATCEDLAAPALDEAAGRVCTAGRLWSQDSAAIATAANPLVYLVMTVVFLVAQ